MINLVKSELLQPEVFMDEGRRQQRFEELINEVTILFNKALAQAIESDDYLRIKKALAEECGVEVVGNQVEFNILIKQKEIAEQQENGARNARDEPVNLNHQIKLGDDIIAHSLGVKIEPQEIKELEMDLINARKENLVPETDPRATGQIINSLRSAARKLDLKSRQTVAKIINIDMGLHISTSDQLINDTFWLQQIEKVINHLRELSGAPDKFKALLLSLEVTVKNEGVES